jgi:DNA polymerase-3 subunit gamma/tau
MTFYLKYRPQTIDEIDITSVRVTLTNILKSGNIPHAFLFAGPRGTGKTSLARILAKAINCDPTSPKASLDKPCNKCESCKSITNGNNIDVIEMDAASNRGIDDIRVLRDAVKLSPANSKAKIYIIDECHMLTNDASNALLKTLEEPPAHVYFILATTNPEKLIETIKSRTTIISFSKATKEELKRSLERIIKKEEIKIKDEELEKIIKLAKGSFRDAVKSLEQFVSDSSFLENSSESLSNELVLSVLKKDIDESLKIIKKSNNVDNLTDELLNNLHKILIETQNNEIIPLIEFILTAKDMVKYSPIEELPLELAIIKWCSIE